MRSVGGHCHGPHGANRACSADKPGLMRQQAQAPGPAGPCRTCCVACGLGKRPPRRVVAAAWSVPTASPAKRGTTASTPPDWRQALEAPPEPRSPVAANGVAVAAASRLAPELVRALVAPANWREQVEGGGGSGGGAVNKDNGSGLARHLLQQGSSGDGTAAAWQRDEPERRWQPLRLRTDETGPVWSFREDRVVKSPPPGPPPAASVAAAVRSSSSSFAGHSSWREEIERSAGSGSPGLNGHRPALQRLEAATSSDSDDDAYVTVKEDEDEDAAFLARFGRRPRGPAAPVAAAPVAPPAAAVRLTRSRSWRELIDPVGAAGAAAEPQAPLQVRPASPAYASPQRWAANGHQQQQQQEPTSPLASAAPLDWRSLVESGGSPDWRATMSEDDDDAERVEEAAELGSSWRIAAAADAASGPPSPTISPYSSSWRAAAEAEAEAMSSAEAPSSPSRADGGLSSSNGNAQDSYSSWRSGLAGASSSGNGAASPTRPSSPMAFDGLLSRSDLDLDDAGPYYYSHGAATRSMDTAALIQLPSEAASSKFARSASEIYGDPALRKLLSDDLTRQLARIRDEHSEEPRVRQLEELVVVLRKCVKELGSRTTLFIDQCVNLEREYGHQVETLQASNRAAVQALEGQLEEAQHALARLELQAVQDKAASGRDVEEQRQEAARLRRQLDTLSQERDRAREDGKRADRIRVLLTSKLTDLLKVATHQHESHAEKVVAHSETVKSLRQERSEAAEQIRDLKEENDRLVATMTAAQLCVTQYEAEVGMLRDLLAGKDFIKVHQDLLDVKHQLSGLQSEGHTLAQQLVATRADRDRYRAGHESLTSQLAAANEERDALAASEAAHLEQIAVLRTRLEGLVGQVEIEKEAWDAERARLQASLAAVTVERDGLAAGVEERDGQVGQLCARLETLQMEVRLMRQQLHSVMEERDRLADTAAKATPPPQQQAELHSWLQELQAESQTLLQQLAAATDEHEGLVAGVADKDEVLADLKSRVEALGEQLERERADHADEKKKLKAALAAAKEEYTATTIDKALLVTELAAAEGQMKALASRLDHLEAERVDIMRIREDLAHQVEMIASRGAQAEQQAFEMRVVLREREEMLGMARTDLERMRQEIEERDVRLAQLEGAGRMANRTPASNSNGNKFKPPGSSSRRR